MRNPEPPHLGRQSLPEFLLERGILDPGGLEKARRLQTQEGIGLVRALRRSLPARAADLLKELGEYYGVPVMQTESFLIDPLVVSEIPEEIARRYNLIALFRVENELTVAVTDPRDVQAVDEVRRVTHRRINLVLADEQAIQQAVQLHYHEVDSLEKDIRDLDEKILPGVDPAADAEDTAELQSAAQQRGTIRLVNLILTQAIRAGASDVHIEPAARKLRVRFRIDGTLREVMEPPWDLQAAIVSRLKIMSNLDIAEKRAPQDGRFQIAAAGRETDVRVSILPTIYGEKVVMRLLNAGETLADMEALGLPPRQKSTLEAWIRRPNGMILVTGPTGSGKTTTLYAALSRINSPERNIVTVEDPVEYRLDIVNQVQVNPHANLTFATGLRSILRQDPDVIMVGEIRDRETAQMAVEAALTGHLVLSTLHTNDAPGAPVRLIDMGVEPFLVASSVLGVVGQRLVRRICPFCKEAYTLPAGANPDDPVLAALAGQTLWRGAGCAECGQSGYRGRTGIYEMMSIGPEVRQAVVVRSSSEQIRSAAARNGYRTMREEGAEQVRQAVTTLEELIRVTLDSR
ncbi:MAG: GspE/PulE family protein [bacterium]